MAVTVYLPDDVFRLPWTVRYYEADQQAVVYHGWYLNYLDEASMAFLDSRGYGYERMHDDNIDVMLVHTEVDWHGSLRWPGSPEIAGPRCMSAPRRYDGLRRDSRRHAGLLGADRLRHGRRPGLHPHRGPAGAA